MCWQIQTEKRTWCALFAEDAEFLCTCVTTPVLAVKVCCWVSFYVKPWLSRFGDIYQRILFVWRHCGVILAAVFCASDTYWCEASSTMLTLFAERCDPVLVFLHIPCGLCTFEKLWLIRLPEQIRLFWLFKFDFFLSYLFFLHLFRKHHVHLLLILYFGLLTSPLHSKKICFPGILFMCTKWCVCPLASYIWVFICFYVPLDLLAVIHPGERLSAEISWQRDEEECVFAFTGTRGTVLVRDRLPCASSTSAHNLHPPSGLPALCSQSREWDREYESPFSHRKTNSPRWPEWV